MRILILLFDFLLLTFSVAIAAAAVAADLKVHNFQLILLMKNLAPPLPLFLLFCEIE